jgi:hypothetical protein
MKKHWSRRNQRHSSKSVSARLVTGFKDSGFRLFPLFKAFSTTDNLDGMHRSSWRTYLTTLLLVAAISFFAQENRAFADSQDTRGSGVRLGSALVSKEGQLKVEELKKDQAGEEFKDPELINVDSLETDATKPGPFKKAQAAVTKFTDADLAPSSKLVSKERTASVAKPAAPAVLKTKTPSPVKKKEVQLPDPAPALVKLNTPAISTQGVVTGHSNFGVAVEYGADPKHGSQEIWFNYSNGIKMNGDKKTVRTPRRRYGERDLQRRQTEAPARGRDQTDQEEAC